MDSPTQILKDESVEVSCQLDCTIHKINGHYYKACPELELQTNLDVEITQLKNHIDYLFQPTFVTMDTIYEGDAVRNFVKRLMLSTRKTTYRNQWLNMYTAHWDHNYKVNNLMKSAALLAIDFYYYGPKFKQWLDKNMSWLCCLEYVILASAVVAYVFAVFL